MKIINIPEYVKDPSYRFTYILVAEMPSGEFQYRKAFYNKTDANKSCTRLNDAFPTSNFKVVSMKDITNF